jgi:hypothetical protein
VTERAVSSIVPSLLPSSIEILEPSPRRKPSHPRERKIPFLVSAIGATPRVDLRLSFALGEIGMASSVLSVSKKPDFHTDR